MISMTKTLLEHFMKKNCKNTNQNEFRVEKIIKRNGDELYVKQKSYDKLFNKWINKNDMV